MVRICDYKKNIKEIKISEKPITQLWKVEY